MSHYFETPRGKADTFLVPMRLWDADVELESSRGVFSGGGLDVGTAVLLRSCVPPEGPVRLPDRTIEVTIQADAFCHSMVRSLMGALTAVAAGRKDRAWLRSLLTLGKRAGDVTVLPAAGLTLEEVGYPNDADLAIRAAEARTTRSLPEDCP